MRHLLPLLLAAAASAASAHGPTPRAPRVPFGTFRERGAGRRLAAEAAKLTAATPYEAVRDTYAFKGPVAGLGFVDHEHDVVIHNTTAFLDDFVDLLESVACAELSPSTTTYAMLPLLPGEGDALRGRRGVELALTVAAGAATELLLHRMSRAQHVILGAGWEAAAPPACSALTSAAGTSTFAVTAVHATAAAAAAPAAGALRGGDAEAAAAADSGRTLVTLTLAPAPLLAGFASARWRHHVDEDVHRALRARGEALHTHYPEHAARGLGSDTYYLFSQGLNWEAGAIVEPLKTLGSWTGAGGNASVRLQCEGCHAYFSSSVTVDLTFCAWARLALRTPEICLFGVCIPSFDFGSVGIGPLGAGCDGSHERETGVGYHLALGARHDASAGFGAGFRVTADLDGTLVDVPRTPVVPAWQSMSFNFFLLGLPVSISVELGLHASLKASGYFHGEARTGVLTATGSTAHGFSFDQRVDGGRVRTVKSILTDVTRTPPSLSLSFGSSALRAELVPTVALVLYRSVRLRAAFPLRLQADLNHTAPDAVLCDLPLCALPAVKRNDGGRLLGVYVTWQPRFALTIEAVRLRDLVAAVPLVGQYASRFVNENFVLFPAQTLVADSALDSRQLIYATCVPAIVEWEGTVGGGTRRRALAAAPAFPPLLLARLELPAPAASAPRARLLTSSTCGNYRNVGDGAPGWWSGSQCSTSGCLGFIGIGGGGCVSTYTLSCSVGSAHTAGTTATCTGTATAWLFGCNPPTYSFNDDSYCRRCSAGQLCPGGQASASSCPAGSFCTGGVANECPCGTYCPSGSVTTTQCPVESYCPARAARPTTCSGGPALSAQLCPAGSCAQLSSSPSPTGTPSPSSSQTPSSSPTASRSPTQSQTDSLTSSITASTTASPTASRSSTPTASRSPSGTPPPTASLSSGATNTQTGTQTPSNSPTPSSTSSPSQTGTGTGTQSPSGTGSRTPPASITGSATATPPRTPPGTPSGTGSASPSRLASPWPSCNRAPVADDAPVFNWPAFTLAPAAQGVVAAARQLRLGFSYLVTARGVPTPQDALELARLSAAAHGTVCAVLACGGSGSGTTTFVAALPRVLGAAAMINETVFNLTVALQATISSSLLPAMDASLLTADDNETFADALQFARAQVASATGSLGALLAGRSGGSEQLQPMLDCATALAANATVAGALGCARALLPVRRLQASGNGSSSNSSSLSNSTNSTGGDGAAPARVPLSFLTAVGAVSAAVGGAPWPTNVTLAWTLVNNYTDLGVMEWVGPNGTALPSMASTPSASMPPAAGTASPMPVSSLASASAASSIAPTAGTASASGSTPPAAAALGAAGQTTPAATPDNTGVAAGGAIAGVLVVALLLLFVHRRQRARAAATAAASSAPTAPVNPLFDSRRIASSGKTTRSTMAGTLAGQRVAAHASRSASSAPTSAAMPDFAFANLLQRQPDAVVAPQPHVAPTQPTVQPAAAQAAVQAAAAPLAVVARQATVQPVASPSVEAAVEQEVGGEEGAEEADVEGAQPDPTAALALAARSHAGGFAQSKSAMVRRQYARVMSAQSNLARAHEKHVASNALRALRRAEDMSEADAAHMILRAWRLRKMRRVQTHFEKVATFDK